MTVPAYNFTNIKVPTVGTTATTVYGVTSAYSANHASISAVVMTLQCANLTTSTILVTVQVQNGSTVSTLVENYPVVPGNAFDPLSGNLILINGDTIVVSCAAPSGSSITPQISVTGSVMEIANAPTA
jgi:hypothetical protein